MMYSERDLVPFAASPIPSGSWLVFAPHPDDESFGMGGSLLLAAQAKIDTHVIVLTDGALGGENACLSDKRYQEAKCAAELLGLKSLTFWGLPDRSVGLSKHLIDKALETLRHLNVQNVFFPSPFEFHPDHRATAHLVWAAMQKYQAFSGRIFSYEISTQGNSNYLIDISSVLAQKKALMQCYHSQLAENNYIQIVEALNKARTYTLANEIEAVEAFFLYENPKLGLYYHMLFALKFYTSEKKHVQHDRKLVSVIVRTKNRPDFLKQALQSVVEQSYPAIEIIVLNDGGADVTKDVETFKPLVNNLRLVQHSESVGRTAAANRGLELAKGEYICFLDDDDYWLAYHLEVLVNKIAQDASDIAYSGTQVVHIDAEQKTHEIAVYNVVYDPLRLCYENFLPIHSVLFHRKYIDQGIRFDENFDLFEDWDFWLQLSQYSTFSHHPELTAVYCLHEKASGVHQGERVKSAYRAIYQKWLKSETLDGLSDLPFKTPLESLYLLLQRSHQWSDEKIADLQDAHQNKLNEIGEQHSQALNVIQERDKQRIALQQQLEQLGQDYQYAQNLVQVRDQQLAAIQRQLAQLGSEHDYAQSIVQARDQQLAEVQGQLAELGHEYSHAQNVVQERDQQLVSVQKQLEQLGKEHKYAQSIVQARDQQLRGVQALLEKLEAEYSLAQNIMKERDKQLKGMERELTEARQHVDKKNQEIEQLYADLKKIKASKRWSLCRRLFK